METYSRHDLIQEVVRKHYNMYNIHPIVILKGRPVASTIMCNACSHLTVPIKLERYGDGTKDYVNWVAEVWSGQCQRPQCKNIHIWVELIAQEEIDKENRRLIRELCDRVLKSLY
jgi:hypothetical protein